MFSHFINLFSDIPGLLLRIPAVLFSLTVHECMHAWCASRCGDDTARSFGRVSLNPLRHLDPIGTLLLLFCGFGWAKPVPVNSRRLNNPRRDMTLIALAGPLSNLVMGFLGVILYHVSFAVFGAVGLIDGMYFATESVFLQNVVRYTLLFFNYFFTINITLAVFNLIPIPPLDGSRLLSIILPARIYFKLMQYERYIYYVLLALVVISVSGILPGVSGYIFYPVQWLANVITDGMFALIELIPFLRLPI